MKKHRKDSRYVQTIIVQVGDLHSLLDMMRYDRCCPAEESEVHKIVKIVKHTAEPGDLIVRLTRYGSTPEPTYERWRSFHARVLYVGSPDEPFPTDDVLKKLAIGEM